jgi:hypothetical protein
MFLHESARYPYWKYPLVGAAFSGENFAFIISALLQMESDTQRYQILECNENPEEL